MRIDRSRLARFQIPRFSAVSLLFISLASRLIINLETELWPGTWTLMIVIRSQHRSRALLFKAVHRGEGALTPVVSDDALTAMETVIKFLRSSVLQFQLSLFLNRKRVQGVISNC